MNEETRRELSKFFHERVDELVESVAAGIAENWCAAEQHFSVVVPEQFPFDLDRVLPEVAAHFPLYKFEVLRKGDGWDPRDVIQVKYA